MPFDTPIRNPYVAAPLLLEQSDFSEGFAPDGQAAALAEGALRDVWNLLIDPASGSLETRQGFARVAQLGTDTGYRVVSMHKFWHQNDRRIIVVTTNDTNASDNVRIYEVKPLSNWTVTRIDTPATWAHPSAQHWGISVDDTFYGGSRGNEMYSWDGSSFNSTAATGSWKTAVNDTGTSVNESSEFAKDYAYKGTEKVSYGGNTYTPAKSIRFDPWGSIDSNDSFSKGDKVTHTISGWGYPTSYICIKAHDPSDTSTEPGVGGSWQTYWRKLQLPLPTDDDGNTNTNAWDFIITAPQTSVATWFANRLWLRADDQGNKARLAYSAPTKPTKGEDIASTTFDPKDFTPGNDLRGPGGGWWDFTDGREDGPIKGVGVYDQYLIVFKGQSVWALSGASDASFTARRLAVGTGGVSETSHCVHRGLMYFLGDDGLYVTDGTSVEPVQGMEKVREWFRARIDENQSDDSAYSVDMWSWGEFVWVSIPVDGSTGPDGDSVTVAYNPATGSFWKTGLPAQCHVKRNIDGTQHLYFAPHGGYGLADVPLIMDYTGDTDDSGAAVEADVPIPWYLYTSWWSFSLHRQQRRVRRTWALVKGAMDYTLGMLLDFDETSEVDLARTVAVEYPTHIEGRWPRDAHAVKLYLDGSAAPAAVHGIAVDTEFRRTRYHVAGA